MRKRVIIITTLVIFFVQLPLIKMTEAIASVQMSIIGSAVRTQEMVLYTNSPDVPRSMNRDEIGGLVQGCIDAALRNGNPGLGIIIIVLICSVIGAAGMSETCRERLFDGQNFNDIFNNANCHQDGNIDNPLDVLRRGSDGQYLCPFYVQCTANSEDEDTVPNGIDNCPNDNNQDQADHDCDGAGDVCDSTPTDPSVPNLDGDLFGDACDPDTDGDGVFNWPDNCPMISNTDQVDHDCDRTGDACDSSPLPPAGDDPDGDQFGNACDRDDDGDGVVDAIDNCPLIINADQANNDLALEQTASGSPVLGNVCDDDDDNDTIIDTTDNCPLMANTDQTDGNNDGQGDACEADGDSDGVIDDSDNCPSDANAGQQNSDGDAQGDACDTDNDNDGVLDATDNCDFTANADQADGDGDSVGNACDNCPITSNAGQQDTDADGVGNACEQGPQPVCGNGIKEGSEACDDGNVNNGDGCSNACVVESGWNCTGSPRSTCTQVNTQNNDFDGDGVLNASDNCPNAANANQADADNDNVGDECDTSTNQTFQRMGGSTGDCSLVRGVPEANIGWLLDMLFLGLPAVLFSVRSKGSGEKCDF